MSFLERFSISYAEKFTAVFDTIQSTVKLLIENHWRDPFDTWLDDDGHMYFECVFVKCFHKQFPNHIDVHNETKLVQAGKSLLYALRAFQKIQPDYTFHQITGFANSYIQHQMEDFDQWCDGIRINFEYDERIQEELAARART
jgi:hypothetical protein